MSSNRSQHHTVVAAKYLCKREIEKIESNGNHGTLHGPFLISFEIDTLKFQKSEKKTWIYIIMTSTCLQQN
jgi:hypothetical protein